MYIGLFDVSCLVYLILLTCVICSVVRNRYWFDSIGLLFVTGFGQFLAFNNIVYIVTPELDTPVANMITVVCVGSGFAIQVIVGLMIKDIIKYWRNY